MINSRTARCAAALVIGVVAVALTGCGSTASPSQSIQQKLNGHAETVDYATGAIGKSDQRARLPSWVPDQASSVSEAIRTTGSERILRFTLSDPKTLTGCHPAGASRTTATLTASWWPSGQESRTDQLCGTDWYVLVQATAVYAYRPETLPQP
ncbi:MAG TPA: hypothetical protein VHW44_22495 [Pseudonocardiaceae bacterium]|jgi:hypothetical protein|nr:hypothetical protein [Pseudonocardiaceae bacterium]